MIMIMIVIGILIDISICFWRKNANLLLIIEVIISLAKAMLPTHGAFLKESAVSSNSLLLFVLYYTDVNLHIFVVTAGYIFQTYIVNTAVYDVDLGTP